MAYTQVDITGYNSGPPADDGSETPTNQVTWARIKSKLFDPVRDAFLTIDDNVNTAVTAAESSVSTLEAGITSLTSNVSSLATTLNAAATTSMIFRQTTPPTGWTKGTDLDDYALRLTTGTISTGGSTAFTSVFGARTVLTANLPAHTHSFSDGPDSLSFVSTSFLIDCTDNTGGGDSAGASSRKTNVSDTTATVSGTYSFSVDTSSTSPVDNDQPWDFAVQYVDCIYATKS